MEKVPRSLQRETAIDSIVYVIDDDVSIREGLAKLFRSVGLSAELFATANEFLRYKLPPVPSCLIVDVRLPGLSGFELRAELSKADIILPTIFITAHGDVPMSVRAMKGGAIDFLTKPFRDQDLLDAVTAALASDRAGRDAQSARLDLRNRYERLTPREREVMALVTKGLMNKHVAAEMNLSEITVKIHRGHVMKKMAAKSLADLVRMAEALGLKPAKSL